MATARNDLAEPVGERTFSSLSNPAFRLIWPVSALSHMGTMLQLTAAAWLMTLLTSSNTMIALVQSAKALPVVFFALFAGAAADIYDKRAIMRIAIGYCAIVAVTLAILQMLQMVTPWILLGFTAMLGVSGAIYNPAWQSALPEMVSKRHFTSAVSLNSLSFNAARCVGPAIAAEVMIRFGTGTAFFLNGISFVLLFAALFAWKRKAPVQRGPRETMLQAIGDGLRYAAISPAMRSTLWRSVSFSACSSAILALPPVVIVALGGGARDLGLLMVGFGAGATTGALSLTWSRSLADTDIRSFVASVVIAISMVALGLSASAWQGALSLFLAGLFWVQIISTLQISIQTACPRWVAGRMVSMLSVTFSLGVAGGSALWGLLAEQASVSVSLFCAGIAMLTVGLLMLFLPFRHPHEDELTLVNTDLENLADKLPERAGPIIISFGYRMPKEAIQAFRIAMGDVRRMRIRDGARDWSLSHNVSDPLLWTEQFRSPTWGGVLRQLSRRVVSDVQLLDRVVALCGQKPEMTIMLEGEPVTGKQALT